MRELLLVQGLGPHWPVLDVDLARLHVHGRVGVLHVHLVVPVWVVVPGVGASRLLPVVGRVDGL